MSVMLTQVGLAGLVSVVFYSPNTSLNSQSWIKSGFRLGGDLTKLTAEVKHRIPETNTLG